MAAPRGHIISSDLLALESTGVQVFTACPAETKLRAVTHLKGETAPVARSPAQKVRPDSRAGRDGLRGRGRRRHLCAAQAPRPRPRQGRRSGQVSPPPALCSRRLLSPASKNRRRRAPSRPLSGTNEVKPTVRNRWPSPTPLHPSRADFSPGWNVYFVLSKSHAVRSSFSVTLLSRVKIPLAPRLSAAVRCVPSIILLSSFSWKLLVYVLVFLTKR